MSKISSDDSPPFLDIDPPSWVARGLAYVLIGLFVAAVGVSVMLSLPETVTSPFVLVPMQGADAVRAFRSGVVADVKVTEGQSLAKGATMLVIRSTDVGDRSSELETLRNQLPNGTESLANARRRRDSERRADEEETRRLAAHLANLEQILMLKKDQLTITNEQLQQLKKATDEGLTSRVQFSDYALKASQAVIELQQVEADRKETLADIEKRRHEFAAREAEFRELERSLIESEQKSTIRIKALSADRTLDAGGNDLIVSAPCTGTVLRLHAQRPGAVVREGDVLGEVGCSEQRLQAELTIPQTGLAQLSPGQAVKLLYDAFPYQRYGVHYGTVRWITPASITVNNASVFRVFVDVSDEMIRVNGQARPLMPGMGGTARVIVGSRSLISYAFGPLRQLRENFLDGPPTNGRAISPR